MTRSNARNPSPAQTSLFYGGVCVRVCVCVRFSICDRLGQLRTLKANINPLVVVVKLDNAQFWFLPKDNVDMSY